MCYAGDDALGLDAAPIPDAIGERIRAEICKDCWTEWLKDMSIKVINEFRLDLSLDAHQQEYDKQMRRFFGFDEAAGEAHPPM
jgi:Fe-S cluster biosynthesis and repair protein YggX